MLLNSNMPTIALLTIQMLFLRVIGRQIQRATNFLSGVQTFVGVLVRVPVPIQPPGMSS